MPTSRYRNTINLKDDNTGNRYKGIPDNISIPELDSDVYITWKDSYNITLLANKYYDNPEYYWIILEANNVNLQSDFETGQQIRIPTDIGRILDKI